jgi:hypothetical protein
MAALCRAAREKLEHRDFAAAEALFAAAFSRNPFEPEALAGLAKTLKARGDFPGAAGLLEASRDFAAAPLAASRWANATSRLEDALRETSGAAVSLLVPTKDRLPLLLDFLQSIPAAARGVSCEVLLLYAEPDADALALQALAGVRVFEQSRYFSGRPSWPRMMNFLLSKAAGRFMMYASDDIVLEPDSIAAAVALLDAAGEDCCGAAMAYKNLTAQNEWQDFGVDLTLGRQVLVNYGLLRTRQAIEAGGFSHAYQFYCADSDLCLKLLHRGKVILPAFAARVVHNDVLDKLKQSNFLVADADIASSNALWEPIFGPLDRNRRRIRQDNEPEARQAQASLAQAGRLRHLAAAQAILPEGAPIKLHLGCGERHLSGSVNIDFPPTQHPAQQAVADIFADVASLDFPAASIEEIQSHHLFARFDRPMALALLARWSRWLPAGGRLVIETPDVLGSFRQVLDNTLTFQQKQAVMRHIFGSHEASWAIHCDGWYNEKFVRVLNAFGFEAAVRDTAWDRPPWLHNTTVVAIKARELDDAMLLQAARLVHSWHMVDQSPCEVLKLTHWVAETARAAGIAQEKA